MKVRFYRQRDMMDCGVACLQSICSCYGREYSQDYVRELCHVTRNGVSLLGICDAAEALGFRTLGAKLTWEQFRSDAHMPCIVHWNQQHFVVVTGISKGCVRVVDPAIGPIKYGKEEFLKGWQQIGGYGSESRGVCLLLKPTAAFYEKESRPAAKVGLARLAGFLKPYRRQVARICLAMLVGSLISAAFPYMTQAIVDRGIKHSDLGLVALILIAELALLLGQVVSNVIRSRLMLRVTMGMSIGLISGFLERLMKLPIAFFESKHVGDILQRVKDFGRIESFLTGTLISTVLSVVTFAVYAVMIVTCSRGILGVFVVGSAAYVWWICAFLERRRRLDYMRFQQLAADQANLVQLVGGMQEIKLNSCERQKRWEWEAVQNKIFKIRMMGLRLANTQSAGASMIDQAKNLVIVFLAAQSVISGDMTIGQLVAVQYIIGQLNAPLYQFVEFLQSLQDAKISLERMSEVDTATEEEQLYGPECVADIPSEADIRLDHVTFRYDGPRSAKVLDDVTLDIPRGKTTAIVGMSGSGKTTLLKLLLMFFEPSEGRILLGGRPLSEFSPAAWRRQVGVVMQDGYIFSDTISRNIALSDSEPDTLRVAYSAKQACIDGYIDRLPMRYNTRIGADGQGLSSGQRQRILIARAIYKNPCYIFFDEATNSLDANNERAINANLGSFFRGRTVVVVAHRLSTVRNADNIVVLSGGRVAEQGTHAALIAARGEYYRLVQNQLEL